MKALLPFLLVMLSCLSSSGQSKEPDFAFPKKVAAQAEKALVKAEKDANGPLALKSLIDYSLAESAIDEQRLQKGLTLINDAREKLDDPVFRALTFLLEARIYSELYNADKWRYDERNLPLDPLPDDWTEWSGAQLRRVIACDIDSVTEALAILRETPVEDYAPCLSYDRAATLDMPTLADFALSQIVYLDPDRRDHFLRLWLSQQQVGSQPWTYVSLLIVKDFDEEKYDMEALMKIYEQVADKPWSISVIQAVESTQNIWENRDTLYPMLEHAIKSFPTAPNIDAVKNLRDRLLLPYVNIQYPEYAVPDRPVKVKIKAHNLASTQVYIYQVDVDPLQRNSYRFDPEIPPRQIAMQEVELADLPKPFEVEKTVEITLPEEGSYVLYLPSEGNKKTDLSTITATRLALAAETFGTDTRFITLDPVDGAPVSGATILAAIRKEVKEIGTTDSDGILSTKPDDRVRLLGAQKGTSLSNTIYRPSSHVYERESLQADILTDLPIYHLGDSLQWLTVVWKLREGRQTAFANKDITVRLFDANGKQVTTTSGTTDGFGRLSGSFTLPKDGLTGRFRLEVAEGSEAVRIGSIQSKGVMVSDYKLPSFHIEMNPTATDMPSKGEVTISGNAIGNDGFPIINAQVEVDLKASEGSWWRWWNASMEHVATLTGRTDSEGNFRIVIPASDFEASPYPKGLYSATIEVTSPTGETQSANTHFNRGPRLHLEVALGDVIDISRGEIDLNVKALDIDGKAETIDLDLTIIDPEKGAEVYSKRISTADPIVDFSSLHAGRYILKFSPVEKDIANPTDRGAILYRPDCDVSPVDQPLWVPSDRVETNEAGKVHFDVWTTGSTWLRLVLHDGRKALERRIIQLRKGRNTLEVEMPDKLETARLYMWAMADFKTSREDITLVNTSLIESLDIKTEVFRDRVTPGDKETWRFRISGRDGSPLSSAFALSLFNEALLQVYPVNNMAINPAAQIPYINWLSVALPSMTSFANISEQGKLLWVDFTDVEPVDFRLYGRMFAECFLFSRTAMIRECAMPAPGAMKNSIVMEDCAVAVADSAIDEGSGAETAPTPEPEAFAYRDSETPLALWSPMLVVDDDGIVEVSFTMPNANATWALRAAAWTRDMISSCFDTSVLASKPLMVKPNLPRFVRNGDKLTIISSVINNSESQFEIEVFTEIFNPSDNTVITTQKDKLTLSAMEASTVAITLPIDASASMLGIRIKASNGAFSDGEQAVIPVLQDIQPVVETKPFYMVPDSTSLSVRLPEMPTDATVTLTVTENPAWNIVTALPGLMTPRFDTTNEAAAAIFSGAVATGLLKKHPDIATELRRMLADPADSSLVSRLEKNADLKITLLANTPWVEAAENQSQRMARLALLTDRKAIDDLIAKAINILAKNVRDDGGWAWMAQMDESSEWATTNALIMLGRLDKAGWLPDNARLRRMIDEAVRFIDARAAEAYRKNPRGNYMHYTFTRDLYPNLRQSTAAETVSSATVQQIIGRWRDLDITYKAVAAIILENHSYHSTARQILESLREYAEYSPEKGCWWPSAVKEYFWSMEPIGAAAIILDAFTAVEPASPEVDAIRQWLILEKENTDWGQSVTAIEVIASFLESSSRWMKAARNALDISLGSHPIEMQPMEKAAGYCRLDISDLQPSGKTLKIEKIDDAPTWGAVYCRYDAAMDSIKAHAEGDVSIEKSVFLLKDGNAVETDDYNLGTTVSVNLLIKATKAMDYVVISDKRAACLEPVQQTPAPIYQDGVVFYFENRDTETNIFISHLPAGTYRISYEMRVNNAGEYAGGAALLQSQYNPAQTANSSSVAMTVKR